MGDVNVFNMQFKQLFHDGNSQLIKPAVLEVPNYFFYPFNVISIDPTVINQNSTK